jgi:hypothetical protein
MGGALEVPISRLGGGPPVGGRAGDFVAGLLQLTDAISGGRDPAGAGDDRKNRSAFVLGGAVATGRVSVGQPRLLRLVEERRRPGSAVDRSSATVWSSSRSALAPISSWQTLSAAVPPSVQVLSGGTSLRPGTSASTAASDVDGATEAELGDG